MTIWRMHIECWIPKATDTHSEYVIPIAFPLQQWLHERALMLRYTYIVSFLFQGRESLFAFIQNSITLLHQADGRRTVISEARILSQASQF